jgi:hypothetical protein
MGVPNGLARSQRAGSLVLGFYDFVQRDLDGAESVPHAQRAGAESRAVSVSVEAGEMNVPNRPGHAHFVLLVELSYDADTPTGARLL